jgi:mono/diheme cytochrome c family protein
VTGGMTLRQYLDQRTQSSGWMLIVFLAMGVLWLFVPPPYHWMAPAVAVAFAVKAGRDSLTTRCPRCHGPLGRLAVEAAAVRSAKDPAVHRRKLEELGGCPSCGLRLDQEIGKPA